MQSKPKNPIPWRRILYEKQPYRDNHYDPTKFFEQLSILHHQTLPQYSYFEAILHASLLAQQFSAVTFFLTIYQFILLQQVSLEALCLLDFVALFTGTIVYFFLLPSMSVRWKQGQEFFRVSLLFLVCLRIASPIIQTLTSAVSEDTIYAVSIVLCLVHLLSHDYQHREQTNMSIETSDTTSTTNHSNIAASTTPSTSTSIPIATVLNPSNIDIHHQLDAMDPVLVGTSAFNVSATSISVVSPTTVSTLTPLFNNVPTSPANITTHSITNDVHLRSRAAMVSLSTAIFTAMMLASRLNSSAMVVAFIIFAVITFTLFPMVCRSLRDQRRVVQVLLAIIQWATTSRLVWLLETVSTSPMSISHPLYFIDWQVFFGLLPSNDQVGMFGSEALKNNTNLFGQQEQEQAPTVLPRQQRHTLFVIYQTLVVLVWIVGPCLFMQLRHYKQILCGPWDIPHID